MNGPETSQELHDKNAISRKGLALLLAMLSPDESAAAEKFHLLRDKLLRFFLWKGAHDPEELADESLTRAARKLEEGVPVGPAELGPYIRGIGRMVFLEAVRDEEREKRRRERASHLLATGNDGDREVRLARLDHCLEEIAEAEKHLIVHYYSDEGGRRIDKRKKQANDLGISMTALRIRAHRLRERLADCLAATSPGSNM